MKKYTLQWKLVGEPAYRKSGFEAPDMEHAVKCGYDFAKGMHGVPIIEFRVWEKTLVG